jgi:hypothetical protein
MFISAEEARKKSDFCEECQLLIKQVDKIRELKEIEERVENEINVAIYYGRKQTHDLLLDVKPPIFYFWYEHKNLTKQLQEKGYKLYGNDFACSYISWDEDKEK